MKDLIEMDWKKIIDHTVLKSSTNLQEIRKLCKEAEDFGFGAVCVSPYYVSECARMLADKEIKIATVIGYPMGYSCIPAKVEEIKRAIDEGVDELDIVINLNAVKSSNWNYVKHDIETTTRAAHMRGKIVKIIFENELCSKDEINHIIQICNDVEPNFVKTSTGNNSYVTNAEDIKFIKSILNPVIKIKASSGISTLKQIELLVEAGADRIGTSSAVKIFGS